MRLTMGIVKSIITKHNETVKLRNEACNNLIEKIDMALDEVNTRFSDSDSFIEPCFEDEWTERYSDITSNTEISNINNLKKAARFDNLLKKQDRLFKCADSLKAQIALHNNIVATERINKAYDLIGKVEGRKLDKQQMMCIVKDTHNHLVIAGAGTGKTTTIVGKIKYLLKSEKCKPEDILVLSFTNASASEMNKRINQETGCNIAASTFHKLGINIITKVDGVVPKISNMNLRNFIKEQLIINMQSDSYLNLLNSYLMYNRVVPKSEFDFKSKAEYNEYLMLNPPTTINNEIVKSYGEMDIANFLAQNSVQYIYEKPYEFDTRTSEYGQYNPDFYLPEYGIYIEYFGINKNGEVPSYFKGKNGLTATQTYQNSIKWKRETHQANGTTMIECFAYEKFDGILLEQLKNNLTANGVKLSPKSAKELWEKLSSDKNSVVDGLIELFETVINLIKSNNYSIDFLRQLNIGDSNAQNNAIIISLLEPIYNSYCSYLSEHKEIDFNDMINVATEYVAQGKYIHPYKYIIVDEYQDISKARFALLNNMRATNDYNLFCVGDDWQSIYRFAGSDIGFILNFEKYWGPSEISKIETTYRFSQSLIEISGSFVMKNPAQIKKSIRGNNAYAGFALGEINGYTDKLAIGFMLKRLDDLPNNSTVFFIGRYSFDVDLFKYNPFLNIQFNNRNGFTDIVYTKRSDLKIRFITAHKSKGLQADYVFIINNKKSKMGFPSKMQDAPILSLLLENSDSYPYSEERRLFYVALTRAKKKAFIVTVKNQESEFAVELKSMYAGELKREQWECPLCGGKLIKHNGPYGMFWGCSNYKTIGCKYKKSVKQNNNFTRPS